MVGQVSRGVDGAVARHGAARRQLSPLALHAEPASTPEGVLMVSKSIMAEVEAVLPTDVGTTPKQVHIALDKWSRVSVIHALCELVREGRAIFDGEDGSRLYRRIGR